MHGRIGKREISKQILDDDSFLYIRYENHINFIAHICIIMSCDNTYTSKELENIKHSIEIMSKQDQIEILKLLSKHLCKLNENKSGIFVNMSFLSNEILEQMKKYIEYTQEKATNLATLEYQKEEFKKSLLNEKEDKDNTIVSYSAIHS